MESSSAQRLRLTALKFLRRFGVVTAVWSTLLALAAPQVERPVLLWSGVGAVWLWALVSQRIGSPVPWWWGWLLTASALELLGPAAGTEGWSVVGGASFIVLAGVALSGRRRWVVGAVAWLSVVAVARGVVAEGWNVGGGIGTVLIFVFGGLALTWLVRVIQQGLDERDRLQRALAAAETQAARNHERAEASARLHDTVLQHLTAVTRAEDLAAARQHAGRASNELRQFLRREDHGGDDSFRQALERESTRAADGAPLSVGVVGDAPLDDALWLLLHASAEAVRNAATHGAPPIRVFAEVASDGAATVWVGDRGPGFDLADVPADRLGVKDSIIGRLERAGGTSRLSSDADGTEWELHLPPRSQPDPADA